MFNILNANLGIKMAARLKQFLKSTKDKQDDEIRRQREVVDKALSLVPRCELNEDLPADASAELLWQAIQENFEWRFGPSKGKSLSETKTQFLKWAGRKLKDPVRTICCIELMLREKKILPDSTVDLTDTSAAPNGDQAE